LKDLTQKIISAAKAMGFIGVGFSSPSRPLFFDQFPSWLSGHKNADMAWLERNLHLREDPSLLLEGCRTIISLAYPYSSRKPYTTDGLSASRFSRPDQTDYHHVLKKHCSGIVNAMKEYDRNCGARICVDSAPVLERSIAYTSGIGFIGKNNMLIIPGTGSYFFLAEIFTSLPFDIPKAQLIDNQCGSCTSCLDACPNGALEKPFSINASKCLSYLTVEYKGNVGQREGKKMGDCFFGCDRCQEACPFNGQENSREIALPSSEEIINMQDEDFIRRFGRTSFKRAGLEKIKGNIAAIKEGNTCG
jgi:epoxyqueuosine reductase